VEPTRPRIGALVTLAALAAGAIVGLLILFVIPIATDGQSPATTAMAAPIHGNAHDGAPYAFWAVDQHGDPLRWDACAPVKFVLNLRDAPEGADEDVRTALDILASATGLDLVVDGLTDEAPTVQRALVEADGTGWRWRPVLIAWIPPTAGGFPLTALDRGLALPVAVRDGEREAYVTGQVVLNAARPDLVPGFIDRRNAVGSTLLHELAHLLGLDHVDDPRQLMSTDPGNGPVAFESGDLAGLERLGRAAGCNPAPPASAGLGLRVSG